MRTPTMTFRTVSQAHLFTTEICGQISDGQWENAEPLDHWEAWSDAEIAIGPEVGRNFPVKKDGYRLNDANLLSVIGERMIESVRLLPHHANYNTRSLLRDLREMKKAMKIQKVLI